VTITAEKLIINGALSVTGDLNVSGNVSGISASVFDLIVNSNIQVSNSEIKSSIVIPKGQSEVSVNSEILEDDSLILVSITNDRKYNLQKNIEEKRFIITLDEPVEEDLEVKYLIIN
jgi:hypothetical protein